MHDAIDERMRTLTLWQGKPGRVAASLRVSLLALLLAGSAFPLAGLAWIEYRGLAEERAATAQTEHEAEALALAIRAEAEGLDAALAFDEDALVVTRDGAYRGAVGSGSWPGLADAAGDSLSGTATLTHPGTGERVHVAWARAPSHDAFLADVRPAEAPSLALGAPFLLLAAFLAGGVLLLLGFVATRVAAPVARLERASRRLARGQWRHRVPEEGPREVRALASSFNALATTIEKQRDALDALLDERTRALIDREGDLEALRFTLAHEFREPLRSLRWMADDLLETRLDHDTREAVRVLRRRIDDLDAVFRDLLRYEDISRRPVEMDEVPLAVVLREAHHLAQDAGPLRLIAGELPALRGDRELLALGLAEVLRNVAQHARTRRGAPVAHVHAERGEERVLLHVDDEGPGIPPARREDALHLFQRLRRDVPGTGAGLAIARRAAERHDGAMTVGESPEGGARVTFHLPLAGPADRTPLPREAPRRRF